MKKHFTLPNLNIQKLFTQLTVKDPLNQLHLPYKKDAETHLTTVYNLARKGLAGSLLGQCNLSLAAADEAGNDLAISVDPLGELLRDDRSSLLALVETFDNRRPLNSSASDVEGQADHSTVLVRVEYRLGVEHGRNTLLGFL